MQQVKPSFVAKQQLRHMYYLATGCSMMMVVWILFLPASWLIGRSSLHTWFVYKVLADDSAPSPEVFRKLAGQTAVHLTHILPGALWAAAIPFQLHPGVRRDYNRLHRLTGYTFLGTSVLLMCGLCIIYQRKLVFTEDFPELPPIKDMMLWLVGISIWFIITGIMAFYHARCKRFALHERWVVRHIAAGLWIALQRIFAMTGSLFFSIPASRICQRTVFEYCTKGAIVVSLLLGEYSLHLLDSVKKEELKRKVK